MDLATATPEQLDRLAAACDPATFGRNREDVYDETYRKAGKLDTANFAVKFDPTRCGIVDIIQASIVEEGRRRMAGLGVRAELYKLNVYGMSFVLFFALFIDGVGAIQVQCLTKLLQCFLLSACVDHISANTYLFFLVLIPFERCAS